MATLIRVFLSYAVEDAAIARRVHLDLERSGVVRPWGFKEDGRFAENFKDELERQIDDSGYFCLLDSPYSRASDWVRHECKRARASAAKMVVCRVYDYPRNAQALNSELFDGHNLIAAIPLADFDKGIRQLFKFLQVAYSFWSPVPRDHDFEQEVWAAGLGPDRSQELLNLYRDFREHFADPVFAEAQLRVVIRKCEFYGAHSVASPRLALGVMHADAGRHQQALDAFKELTVSHPLDPRAWAGLAGAHFHLSQYRECLEALARSRALSTTRFRDESAARIPELVHNLAAVHLLLGDIEQATACLNSLSLSERDNPAIKAIEGRIAMFRGDCEGALRLLLEAAKAVDVSPATVEDIADCYASLGQHTREAEVMRLMLREAPENPQVCHRSAIAMLREGGSAALSEALAAMKRAAALSTAAPRYRAQYAALLKASGDRALWRAEAEACVALAAPTAEDRYYRGLAYYLLGQADVAKYEWAFSRKDRVVATWPSYAALCESPVRTKGSSARHSSMLSNLARLAFGRDAEHSESR